MANTFELIGKMSISKPSEKFLPYETNSYDNGWSKNKLIFNVQSAENRHMLVTEGMRKDDGTGVIFSLTKGTVDEKTNEKKKGENIQIPWKDRNDPEIIERIAEFKKYVIDLETYGRRYKLENALQKQQEGNLSDEELKELGVEASELEKAVEESQKKRKVFLAEYDFTEYLYKLISSGKIDKKIFRVLGEIVYSYYNGKFYKRLIPTRIYLVGDNEEQVSFGQIQVYFNKESLDSGSFKETKKYYLNGFVRNYDRQRKETISAPIQLVLDGSGEDEKATKLVNLLVSQFKVKDNSWKEFGLKVKLLDGAQKVEITDEMLTDFQKEMLELEVITMDDIRKEIGGDVYGEKVQEMVIVNVAKGYTKGRKDTVFVDSDFEINEETLDTTENNSSPTNDEELFDDLDDILG